MFQILVLDKKLAVVLADQFPGTMHQHVICKVGQVAFGIGSSTSLGKISLGYSGGDGLSLVDGLLVGHDLEPAPPVVPERVVERRPGHDVLLGVAEVDE